MLLITPKTDIKFWQDRLKIETGKTYLVEHSVAGHLMAEDLPGVKMVDGHVIHGDPDDLLIIRPGGIGDLVFLTPSLRKIKAEKQGRKITLCTMSPYHEFVGTMMPWVDDVIDYPLEWTDSESRHIVAMEHCMEFNPMGETHHAVDCIAHRLGLEITDRQCQLFLPDDLRKKMADKFPKNRIRIGVNPYSTTPTRDWPAERTKELCALIVARGWQVAFFDSPGKIKVPDNEHLLNLTNKGLSLVESIATLTTCDAFVGPDSGMLHCAGALRVRGVGIYGPFPWRLRTDYQPTLWAVQGRGACAPCTHHARKALFPPHCPTQDKGHCGVLASVTADDVMRHVVRAVKGK